MARRIFWCSECSVPLFDPRCELCGNISELYMAQDLVPVFKEEMALLRKEFGFSQLPKHASDFYLWKYNSSYFRLGHKVAMLSYQNRPVPVLNIKKDSFSDSLSQNRVSNRFNISNMVSANKSTLERIEYEAQHFILKAIADFPTHKPMVSFSGGKDSTVISTLVQKAIGASDTLHVFLDTTLESDDTYSYIAEYKQIFPKVPLMTVKPNVDFFEMCNLIGPPSRLHRWCCTSHKAAPMGMFIGLVTENGGILNFDGIRAAESVQRARRSQVTLSHAKIAQQVSASIIYNWTDLNVWTYILKEAVPFNFAYRRGFNRVGCLYCPYTAGWAEYLNSISYPRQHKKWKGYLRKCAVRAKLDDPEEFSTSTWKGRSRGKELDKTSLAVNRQECLTDDNAFIYSLPKEKMGQFLSFILPLGDLHLTYGDSCTQAYILSSRKDNLTLARITINNTNSTVRVVFADIKGKFLLKKRFERQIRKLQSCTCCGACGAICPHSAIKVTDELCIDAEKCVSCLRCVSTDCVIVKSLGS